jgi:hypothetical protein
MRIWERISEWSGSDTSTIPAPIPAAKPVLLYNGTGTSRSDVAAIEAVLAALGVGYITANSSQLAATSGSTAGRLQATHRPGRGFDHNRPKPQRSGHGNDRDAVAQYSLHYLGIGAGAFFGGYSTYNGVDLASGVWFNF